MLSFSHAGMSKGVLCSIIVPPALFSKQAGHVVYTFTIDLTVEPDPDSNQCVEIIRVCLKPVVDLARSGCNAHVVIIMNTVALVHWLRD